MTTEKDLLDIAITALTGATDAQNRVYQPGDWAAWDNVYPALKVRIFDIDKQSLGRAGPMQFNVVATLRIIGQVNAPATDDDAGAGTAVDALWTLQRQCEIAIVNSYPLTAEIQQITFIRAQLAESSQGETHLASLVMDIGLEFYQGVADFAPIDGDDLVELEAQTTSTQPLGFTLPNLQS